MIDDHAAIRKIIGGKRFIINSLYGGDINRVYKVIADQTSYVVKLNAAEEYPKMFEQESTGLKALSAVNGGVDAPEIVGFGRLENLQYLVLNYIAPGEDSNSFWRKFSSGLIAQHKTTASHFGFEGDNYIGSLHQSNKKHTRWDEFFIAERMIPQIKLAQDQEIISPDEVKKIEAFFVEVPSIWPEEPPALLHGDLWSGNFLVGKYNKPYLIDPSVYYGHREIDIGMSQLFGGFDPIFLDRYNNLFALEKGWEDRVKYNQLYPLMVHLNLFGRSYLSKILFIVHPFL